MAEGLRVGFVGLGVMGAPMCGHLHAKRGPKGLQSVTALDLNAEARASASQEGIAVTDDLGSLVAGSDQIHVCLPGGAQLQTLCIGNSGTIAGPQAGSLLALTREGQTVIDHGTSPVGLTRELAHAFAARGATFVDAPITRTRAAAEAGTLVVLFGGSVESFEHTKPVIEAFAEEVFHCGDVGAGQVVKQMNNMVLIQTVVGIGEALATARAAGVEGETLFAALEAGSGDSFALRNHGRKAMLPGVFPERAFSTTYALKDLDYAISLARQLGLDLNGAHTAKALLEQTIAAGNGDAYWPVVGNTIASNRRSEQ